MPMNALGVFNRLYTIPSDPKISPSAFCESQPCVNIHMDRMHFILNQPTSSTIVYVLGALWLFAGLYFIRSKSGQKSRLWWGIALLLGGIAAISAGTSYQAFGYEIKCAGRAYCAWTSWWEVAYLVLQTISMDAMMIALAYACAGGKLRRTLITYALVNAAVYLTAIAVGALVPVKFMISFEFLVLFTTPNLLILFVLCGWRYARLRDRLDLSLLQAGILLIMTTAVYFAYMTAGITQKLWKRGIWFSDNDVLHLCMILWIVYTAVVLGKHMKDSSATPYLTTPS